MSLIDDVLKDLEKRQQGNTTETLCVAGLKISGGKEPRVLIARGQAKYRERTGWSSTESAQLWSQKIPLAVNENCLDTPMLSGAIQEKFSALFQEKKKVVPKKKVSLQQHKRLKKVKRIRKIHARKEVKQFRLKRFMVGTLLGMIVVSIVYPSYEGRPRVLGMEDWRTAWQSVQSATVALWSTGKEKIEDSYAYVQKSLEPPLQPLAVVMPLSAVQQQALAVAVVPSLDTEVVEAEATEAVLERTKKMLEAPVVTEESMGSFAEIKEETTSEFEDMPHVLPRLERLSDARDKYSLDEIARLAEKEAVHFGQTDIGDPHLRAVPAYPKGPGIMRKRFRKDTLDTPRVIQKVDGFERVGRIEEAIGLLQNAIVRSPETTVLRERLAEIYLEKERYFEAHEVLEEGLLQAPMHMPFVKLMARTLVTLEHPEQAIALLSKELPPVSEDPEVHAILGALYQRTGDHEMAMQTYWHLLDYFPEGGRWWTGLAISLEATGETVGALDGYRHAVKDYHLKPSLRRFATERIHALSSPS